MPNLDENGMLAHPRIVKQRYIHIEHGDLASVHAIVIHQTDSSTAQSTFSTYPNGGNGAHFLIDKSGTIYQTASLKKRCFHVGRFIKSKCLEIKGKNCADSSIAKTQAMTWAMQIKHIDAIERTKTYPERYPVNSDSIGIELVGRHLDDKTYEALTLFQIESLHWLIDLLYTVFDLSSGDVFRHSEVSYKNPGEAKDATW